MSTRWKIALGVAAAVVGVNVGLTALDRATQEPKGPTSSSFATAPAGVAAYAELLRRYEHPVVALRTELADADLDPAATVVLLDPPPLRPDEEDALLGFVRAGGRLVASGDAVAPLGGDIGWDRTGDRTATDRGDLLPSVERVRATGDGSWSGVTPAKANVLLGSAARPLLLRLRGVRGAAFLLADTSPLQNGLLAEADNAALGLELAGPARRPVLFLEAVHGYGEATGVTAIPGRWWWVLGGLALAALLYALACGRRFGPPERQRRELSPPRAEFADAIAAALAKVRPRSEAVATARRVVRERLARAARLSVDAPDDSFRRAAGELGLGSDGVEAVLGGRSDDAALLALGRLLGDLDRKEAVA